MKIKRIDLRNNLSVPEQVFWRNIKGSQLGYKFRRQRSVGNYIVDFYCPKLNLVIEIDGDSHVIDNNAKTKDKIREGYLERLNLKIKRYNNRDVLYNTRGIFEDLRCFIESIEKESVRTTPSPSFAPPWVG